jgi:hypothetical protein
MSSERSYFRHGRRDFQLPNVCAYVFASEGVHSHHGAEHDWLSSLEAFEVHTRRFDRTVVA